MAIFHCYVSSPEAIRKVLNDYDTLTYCYYSCYLLGVSLICTTIW